MTLKERLLAGETLCGCFIRFVRNPALIMLAKNAGLDWILIDNEHGFYSMETFHDLNTVAKEAGIELIFRAAAPGKAFISPYLDAGASGVLMPLTETAEQAAETVQWSKYPPLGSRGFCGWLLHQEYKRDMKHTEMLEQAQKEIITIAQIETKLGVENAYEIAAVEGVDAIFVGPNDLSISLGCPGDLMNPIELEAIERVIDACKKHNKAFSMLAGPALMSKYAEHITLAASHQSDLDLLRLGFKTMDENLRACFVK